MAQSRANEARGVLQAARASAAHELPADSPGRERDRVAPDQALLIAE